MNKKKKKNFYDDEYDYSDIHYDGDFRELCQKIANSIEEFMELMETYAIFDGMTEDEWNSNIKKLKKLCKKLRKGDPSVFDIDRLNELLDSGHGLII